MEIYGGWRRGCGDTTERTLITRTHKKVTWLKVWQYLGLWLPKYQDFPSLSLSPCQNLRKRREIVHSYHAPHPPLKHTFFSVGLQDTGHQLLVAVMAYLVPKILRPRLNQLLCRTKTLQYCTHTHVYARIHIYQGQYAYTKYTGSFSNLTFLPPFIEKTHLIIISSSVRQDSRFKASFQLNSTGPAVVLRSTIP